MKYLYLCVLLCIAGIATAQDKKEWDVAVPEGEWNFKEMELSTSEGTWMNLDVSPDGSQVVFDLLGDIYIMPTAGGKATALRSGLPFEVQPRFNPDGTKISFTSDAGGGDNIWVMNTDGSDAHQVTKEDFRLLNNAIWTPDGDYLIARKHFTSGRSLGAGEMWMYHITGGSGLQLTKRKNDQQDVNEPYASPDGKYLYYCEDVYPGGYFQYNKDPNSQIYQVHRYDMETGEVSSVTGGPGGACRPTISNNGKYLAFVKRVRTKTVLYLHDLATGEEWPIYDKLNKDQQEAWAIFGTYPNFDWSPDDKYIYFWAEGKIKKIEVGTSLVTDIPFEVENNIKIAEALKFKRDINPDKFEVKDIRNAVTSPDGKWLVFNALGRLYRKELPNGEPERITSSKEFEFEPAFTPDGNTLVYVSWEDENMGAVKRVSLKGRKRQPVEVTSEKGIYRTPSISPDGKTIVYVKESGNSTLGGTFDKNPGIYSISIDGGEGQRITEGGEYPQFNASGDRIFYQTGGYFFGNLTKRLKSVNLDGDNEITHVESKYANRLIPSPDNKWVAFMNLHKAYLAPLPLTGQTLDIDPNSKSVPVAPITRDAGINLHWSADSKKIHWTLGDEYFTNDINERFTFLEGSPDSIPPVDTVGVKVALEADSYRPSGIIAFTGATIITMEGDQVIENGTIVINGNKIEAIGDASVAIPAGAKVYDVQGKTIMPGFVDVHAHVSAFGYGITPQKHWPLYANLAYGVTTAHDPSANTETVFALSELIKAGEMTGPRLFSTGIILYGADGDFKAKINSLEDARSALRRTKAFGAFSVKSYNQPRRNQRQQVIQAARELNMLVVPEGGSTFYHNMTMVMDGHTGIEHNIPVAPVYKDVLELWGNSNSGYTPTLIVNYGGLNGEYYFYQNYNVWEDEKLLTFYPRGIIDSRSRYRTMAPEEEYQNGHILVSETCKALADHGVKVNLGAHGQLHGLGAHWELWMLKQGGMSNMEALKAATINGANYLGIDEQVGSLKEGKLADLIVLDKNPLNGITNTNSVRYTMANGRLYDAATMNEVGNHERERTKFYWENNKYNQSFDWHETAESYMRVGCSCEADH
ncbi:amidohydrolase family protein [Fulvivirga sediminis]|uniref:PD40 domain-containing protein n=1 Tax=Fulvivirga sediminis TaxID=2803949 RepID=A0A937FBJ6_9BACT|nr:amidohydrolase family protein [Fulvivirga sediminis]MBL3658627.1 PD40 domain-containing protein [Fulvivirga sediminis]